MSWLLAKGFSADWVWRVGHPWSANPWLESPITMVTAKKKQNHLDLGLGYKYKCIRMPRHYLLWLQWCWLATVFRQTIWIGTTARCIGSLPIYLPVDCETSTGWQSFSEDIKITSSVRTLIEYVHVWDWWGHGAVRQQGVPDGMFGKFQVSGIYCSQSAYNAFFI